MHILLTLTLKKNFFSSLPVQRQPGGLQHLDLEAKYNFFKIGKLHPKNNKLFYFESKGRVSFWLVCLLL